MFAITNFQKMNISYMDNNSLLARKYSEQTCRNKRLTYGLSTSRLSIKTIAKKLPLAGSLHSFPQMAKHCSNKILPVLIIIFAHNETNLKQHRPLSCRSWELLQPQFCAKHVHSNDTMQMVSTYMHLYIQLLFPVYPQ